MDSNYPIMKIELTNDPEGVNAMVQVPVVESVDESQLDAYASVFGKFMFVCGFPQFRDEYVFARGVNGDEYESLDEHLKEMRKGQSFFARAVSEDEYRKLNDFLNKLREE